MNEGDKDIKIDCVGFKIYLRLYVFMLMSHFFLEGLPKYSIDDDDLPNSVTLNEEDAPKMCVELNLNETMVCLDDE